jgi:uncharacterized protein (DUF362 family)
MAPVRPRKENVFTKDGKPLVAKVPHYNGDYMPFTIRKAVELLGGLDKTMKPGDTVILKPNFNCSFATPLSTDLAYLAAVIELLQDYGVKVKVAEMCGRADWPTEKVVQNLEVLPVLKRYGVPFICLFEDEWVEVDINGKYWQKIHVPRTMYEADHRIYCANMRTHSAGRYSCTIKLGVGWLHPDDREIMHSDRTKSESMIAEINLAFQPDLVFVDGRRSTIEWAGRGPYVHPNVVMASGDIVAADSEAVKILRTYPAENRIQIPFDEIMQITTAAMHKLGSTDYTVVEAPGHERTEEDDNRDPATLAVKGLK